ncbi:hypothetical protein [Burkholderia ubonensis]|uniref:hypothetical protein n=2 Tax=Burkholderia ubonensis TaxID=101571 RepID=UPI001160E359|nr:hypothetical protein [Burkholderia ubonensis]
MQSSVFYFPCRDALVSAAMQEWERTENIPFAKHHINHTRLHGSKTNSSTTARNKHATQQNRAPFNKREYPVQLAQRPPSSVLPHTSNVRLIAISPLTAQLNIADHYSRHPQLPPKH